MKVRITGSRRRTQTRTQARWCPVGGEPAVRQVELAVGDEYVAAVALEEGSAAPGAGVVGHERADGVAEGAEEGGEEQPLEAVAGILDQQPAGQRHDDLAGEGDGRALHGHEEDDAGPTDGVVNGVGRVKQRVFDAEQLWSDLQPCLPARRPANTSIDRASTAGPPKPGG